MAYNIRVHNPGPYEVVMDMRGRIVAGHTSIDGDRNDRYTARLIDRKVLLNIGDLDVKEPEPEPEPEPTPEPEPEPAPARSRSTTKTTTKSTASAGAETGEKK